MSTASGQSRSRRSSRSSGPGAARSIPRATDRRTAARARAGGRRAGAGDCRALSRNPRCRPPTSCRDTSRSSWTATAAGPGPGRCPISKGMPPGRKPSGDSSSTRSGEACRCSRCTPSAARTGLVPTMRLPGCSISSARRSATRRMSFACRACGSACWAGSRSCRRTPGPRSARRSTARPMGRASSSTSPGTTRDVPRSSTHSAASPHRGSVPRTSMSGPSVTRCTPRACRIPIS